MHFAGHGDVPLKLLLLSLYRLVEASVFDCDGHLCGHGGEHALMLLIKEGRPGVFQVHDADDAALVKKGHNQLGARFGIHGQIA